MPTGGFISITINYEGANGPAQITRRLATWGAQISDLSEPFTQIGEDLLGDFMANIVSEGGLLASGKAWAPLAFSTVRERARLGYGGAHPILYREGFLADSLAYKYAPGNVFEVSPTALRVGSEVYYAGYHQSGTLRMPRRQIVGINWARRAGIVARLNEFVQRAAADQGIALAGGV